MFDFLSYVFMQKALLVGISIAIATSSLGLFVVLRRMSLLGDGLAHISLGGVVLGAIFNIYPLISALIFSILSALGIEKLRKDNLYSDLSIALFFSFGLAIGVIGISSLNFGTNIMSYLFGSIVAINNNDLCFALFASLLAVIFIILFRKQLFYLTFDEELAIANGINVDLLNKLLIIIVAFVIVASIKVVGILLVSSLLTAPVAIALNFKNGFYKTLLIAIFFSVISVVIGLIASYYLGVASGGAIVFVLIMFFILSSIYKNLNYLSKIFSA